MATTIRYPLEVHERAVRLVVEHREDCSSERAAIGSIAATFGCAPEPLRGWSGRVERDGGLRPGLRSDQETELVRLRRRAERKPSQPNIGSARSVPSVIVRGLHRLAASSSHRRCHGP